jgi:error-prone DNA polymerase
MYVEFQSYSNFSFLRGASSPEELVKHAASLGYPAIALSDRHSMAGIVRAHFAAKKYGISMLVGAEIPLYEKQPQTKVERQLDPNFLEATPSIIPPNCLPLSLLLYPTSKSAYANLCKLLSIGKRRAPKARCFLSIEDVAAMHHGLLAVAVVHSFQDKKLLEYISTLKNIFDADRLSLQIARQYGPDGEKVFFRTKELSQLTGIPLLATNDVHYHIPDRAQLQDVLTCIRHRCRLDEAGFRLYQNRERYLKTPQEMKRLFRKEPQAIERSLELYSLARGFSLDQITYEYPREICPQTKTPLSFLTELVQKGAKEFYPQGVPDKVKRLLRHELQLVHELGYEKYFLTVYDIVCFARSQKILCQGRGAAANSAICYVLGMTSVDPDKINLLFERFVSKERNEPPDIDIDFEHERREEVIQYIYNKYSRERAALTATVITYRTKSAVRDVGKVFKLSEEEIEGVIKLLRRTPVEEIMSEASFTKRNLDYNKPEIHKTIELVYQIKGFPRHLSQHVGGFIISDKPLYEIVPTENAAMENRTVIEWDKDDIELMGMLKIDILALGIMTMIRKALEMIHCKQSKLEQCRLPRHSEMNGSGGSASSSKNSLALEKDSRGKKYLEQSSLQQAFDPLLAMDAVPAEDPEVYRMVSRADTIGVFQIESRAQMSMLPRMKPRCFYDLVVEVAIVRPGPIQGGMVHPYLRRRMGEEPVSYPSKQVKEILQSTLGVPIFQEQIMQIAVVAAGFSPGEADQLRRAMGSWKRNKNALAQFETRLISGMRKRGYTAQFAKQVCSQIKGFSEYGFPQSHAASFALLVYVSAWIKMHHPAEFAAALINSQPMGFYRPAQIIQDAKNHGVSVRAIDVIRSEWDCTIEKDNSIRLGFRLIRGLKKDTGIQLRETIKKHPGITNLKELWLKSGVSVSQLKKLCRADAFLSMNLSRQKALWEIKKFRDGPLPLFENIVDKEQSDSSLLLPQITKKSSVLRDYESNGLSLKSHPMSFLRKELSQQGVFTCYELVHGAATGESALENGQRIAIGGIVLLRQQPMTASGIVFMTIEDETGLANLIIKPRIFKKYRDEICDGNCLISSGRIQREKGVVNLIADDFQDVSYQFGLDSQSRDFH